MPQSDIDYWLTRASEERTAAEASADARARSAHLAMAHRYAKAARGGTIAVPAHLASDPAPPVAIPRRRVARSPDTTLYHLNIFNMRGEVRDEDGAEFANLTAAHSAALAGIRTLLGYEAATGKMDLRGRLEVVEGSDVVLTVPFEDAIQIVRA